MAGSGCWADIINSDDIGGSNGVEFDVLFTSFFSLFSSSDTWFSNAPKLMKSMNFHTKVPMNLFSEFVYKKVSSSGISFPIKFVCVTLELAFSPNFDSLLTCAKDVLPSSCFSSSIMPPSLLYNYFGSEPLPRYL